MPDVADEVADLIERAEDAHAGPVQVALYERAIALADSSGDDGLAFEARQEASFAFYGGGRPDLLLVHFARMLAHLDGDPDESPVQTLFQYRWVVDVLPGFATITREQIDRAWADLRDRYKGQGFGVRAVWWNRLRVCLQTGDLAGAADARRKGERAARGFMADDADTETVFSCQHHAAARRDAQAVAVGGPYFTGARGSAYAQAAAADSCLLPLVRLGRLNDARSAHKLAARHVAANPELRRSAANFPLFLTVAGDLPAAVRAHNKDFPVSAAAPAEFDRVPVYTSALVLARELVRRNRSPALSVPDGLVPGVEGTRTTPGVLRDWLEVALPELSARADARNGNGYHTGKLAELDEYAQLAREVS